MTETYLKQSAIKWIKKTYPKAWIYCPVDRVHAGIPDLFVFMDNKLYVIELKVNKNYTTRLQKYNLKVLADNGAVTGVCYSLEEVKRLINSKGGEKR